MRALCSTRAGGVSRPPYDSLNLGDHVGDEPQSVAENRRRFAQKLQVRPVFMRQVHAWRVAPIDANTPDGIEADACIATDLGIACTIMVADCLPVLFAHSQGRGVAAAHAGWRGLAGESGRGVLEATWEALANAMGGDKRAIASRTLVWLGPCIGPEAFEVGPDVRQAFVSQDPASAEFFKPQGGGKWLADLQALARLRLRAMGIERVYGNDGSARWCTVANPSIFFSHRRDRISGRFAASVWLV